jgi:hemolysin activation/secretion protein
LIAGAAGLALVASPAVAQVLPPSANPALVNNQTQRNEQQLQQKTDLPQGPSVVTAPGQFAVSPPGGPTFVLRGVVVGESHFLSKADIDAITSKYVGTKVDISAIQRMVKEINDLFTARGVTTAAAFLPPQKLKDGVVRVQIVEGRLDHLKVTGANALSKDFVLAHVETKPGEIIDLPQISDRLSMFNSTGVARVQAALQAGARFGLTDIDLGVTEPDRFYFQPFVDNQGVSSVGALEAGFLAQFYAPLSLDDRVTVYGVKSNGNLYGSIAYSIPFDTWGGRAGITLGKDLTHVTSGPYQPLDITGENKYITINAVQPIFATGNWVVSLNGAMTWQNNQSYQTVVPTTNDDARLASAGFKIAYNSSTIAAFLAPTVTRVESNSAVSLLPTDFWQTGGQANVSAQLPGGNNLVFNGVWQVSSALIIPSAELFQIGGPTTVRGYPTNAVAGNDGFFTNLEFHHPFELPGGPVDAFVFYDEGAVYNQFPAVQDLNSVGAGVTVALTKLAELDLSVGVPLNHVVDPQPPAQFYFRVLGKF